MARILVTGGAGFIGSTLVDRLQQSGHVVGVVDNLSTGRRQNLEQAFKAQPHVELHEYDIATDALDDCFRTVRPDVVFHLAAQMDVRRSVADPVFDAMVNVIGTVRLLEVSRRSGVEKVVFTSSGGCIYGEPEAAALPIDEQHPGHPHSPYGASKRSVEEYFHTFESLYGLRWTVLALANVYGPRQDPSGEAGVVSIFGQRMLDGEPVAIYGDGEQTRDLVYVEDVVDACVRALDSGDGLRLNIGTGEATSVNELFSKLAELTGYQGDPQFKPARPGELEHIALRTALARDVLGWRPRTSLAQGLEHTLDWLAGSR